MVSHPALGDADIGVGLDGVVASEVESEKGGDGAFGFGGGIEEEVEVGGLVIAEEVDADFFAVGEAVQGFVVLAEDFESEAGRNGWGLAIDMGAEEPEDFGAALGAPLFRGGDRGAVLHEERVGQGKSGDLGFVVVGIGRAGRGDEGDTEAEEEW